MGTTKSGTGDEDNIIYVRNILQSSSRSELYNLLISSSFVQANKDHPQLIQEQSRRVVYYFAIGDTTSYKIRLKQIFWRLSVKGFEKVTMHSGFNLHHVALKSDPT